VSQDGRWNLAEIAVQAGDIRGTEGTRLGGHEYAERIKVQHLDVFNSEGDFELPKQCGSQNKHLNVVGKSGSPGSWRG
jgi:hypothetical protein